MPSEPIIKPLSQNNRIWTFRILLAVFCIAMPVFVFYAMGYRVDFGDEGNIITVGGLYISADADDVLMFVDEEPVEDMRIFQQAAYIQNLDAGVHRIHVQREGLQTWVKELPVYPHIVTEAESFNIPAVPQIRFIPEWLTAEGLPVLITDDAETVFPNASTTNTVIATTSPRTGGYTSNTEYEYVASLFAAVDEVDGDARRAVDVFQQDFSFNEPRAAEDSTSTATTTKILRDMRLYESGDEVYAEWTGLERNLPYYYCVMYTSPATTTEEYGEHVYESLLERYGDTHDLADPALSGTRLCRDTIRIDRIGQKIEWFDFMPNDIHHVLLVLEDGLYVVEVDDRAWQNVQLLYPGDDLEMRIDGGRIYVFDGEHYFEVFTELAA